MLSSWNHVLVYAPATGNPSLLVKLRELIAALDPLESVESCGSLNGLGERLRQPRGRPGVIVLLPGSREDILDLLSMASLFDGLRLVVALPDRDADTVTKGYALGPRFLTYSDGGLADIAAVIEKMCNGARI
jgi:hypothetical protein